MDVKNIKQEMAKELVSNILPFWMEKMTDEVHGGFYGRITGMDELKPEAEKGAVLNARILWTFSAAYRLLRKPEYLEVATRAKRVIIDHFYDSEFGGVYWSLDNENRPLDTKKQIYALGFAIYGLSEYARATDDKEALDYAIRLFGSIERHSFDALKNGYCEALTREWGEIADMRLSAKDANECKTMNTHLHILEPYTNLFRVWKDAQLEKQLRNLISIFVDKILNIKTGHLDLFFNEDWVSKYRIVSYGHDIEASWLIHEAALVLGDKEVLAKVEPLVEYIAAAADEGLMSDGSMIYETFLDKKQDEADRHWWVQAENIVGHVNLYQHFGDEVAMQKALRCWEFIKKNLIDYKNGEWHWSVRIDGTINTDDDKAGFWKCPYHNGRMCMEVMERF
ncbi:N-acyl-D-glucosamine 2-epimerase [Bacteroides heparinolyticus]|uniref:Cellobiose 2-epimerase n=1 Tax=Prevotella heparinolytica TaxID=28113 RepID=A0A2R3MV64_9BACE|nr:AGE family epimerase/isomerase [Bacteroides heparinolyticus]AVM58816.1 N-acyl-D-glucosamine 2-epimerase [Bacteroides heparinolyticus]TCO91221.1 mannobiose 2-epimerase [Bacteroides heparinolyticus]